MLSVEKEMENKKWAFLIGIDEYDELSSFKYCARHVEDLKRILIEEGGYPEKNIMILPPKKGNAVNRTDIIKEFPRFLWQMEDEYNHTFFIYFIGHGAYQDTLYLLTSDSFVDANNPKTLERTGLEVNFFEEALSRFQFPAWNVFMFIDACQTGMLPSHGEDDEAYDEEESKELQASLPSGISYLYSCKPLHKGYSFKEKDEFNSIFSFSLIETLKAQPKPISFGEVVKRVRNRTNSISKKHGKPLQYPDAKGDIEAYKKILLGDELSEESIQKRTPITQKPEPITQKPEPITQKPEIPKSAERSKYLNDRRHLDEDFDYYWRVGMVYFSAGALDEALEFFTNAIRHDENYVEAYINRGRVYLKMNKYKKALADYNEAIKLDKNYVEAYIYRGFLYYRKGKYQLAIEDFNHAIEIDSKHALAYAYRCEVYFSLGEKELAVEDIKVAKKLDPKVLVNNLRVGFFLRKKLFPADLASLILSHLEDIYDSFSEEEKKVIDDVKIRV